MDIVKIVGIGLTALIIIIILRQYRPEFAVYASMIARYIYTYTFFISNIWCNKFIKGFV